MTHRIFLSHTHTDKPLVEAVALRLKSIFGQNQVFYDSWSIRPGDSIIDQMSRGLDAPEYVFFFVSKNSLASGMVKLEWQNALYAAAKGKTRIIPVRIDGSDLPSILRQTLFIDMHTIGLEAAIAQIVSVTQGNASFTPQHQGFSNLTQIAMTNSDGSIDVTVKASHLAEPSTSFAFVVLNTQDQLGWWIKGQPGILGHFQKDMFTLAQGGHASAVVMRPLNMPLTPSHPITFELKRKGDAPITLIGVMHQRGENEWVEVPRFIG